MSEPACAGVAKSMATSVLQAIMSMGDIRALPNVLADIGRAIQDSGFPEQQQADLSDALASQQASAVARPLQGRKDPQELTAVWNYPTSLDWEVVKNHANHQEVVGIFVDRFVRGGLTNPSQKTYARVTALVGSCFTGTWYP